MLVQIHTIDSFGNQTASRGSLTNPFQYSGRESDPEAGLHYYRARYYDPTVGRFLSEDPTNFTVGPNFYTYAENSPTGLVDPSGLTPSTNWKFFWDWLLERGSGHDGDTRWYAGGTRNWSGSPELTEMINSPGAEYMRNRFKKNGCNDILHDNYGTFRAAWDTVLPHIHWGSTSAQVGGFTFAVINIGGGNVEYRVLNVAGTNSFFYHTVPDKQNSGGILPIMGNLTQRFRWVERNPCPCKR